MRDYNGNARGPDRTDAAVAVKKGRDWRLMVKLATEPSGWAELQVIVQ